MQRFFLFSLGWLISAMSARAAWTLQTHPLLQQSAATLQSPAVRAEFPPARLKAQKITEVPSEISVASPAFFRAIQTAYAYNPSKLTARDATRILDLIPADLVISEEESLLLAALAKGAPFAVKFADSGTEKKPLVLKPALDAPTLQRIEVLQTTGIELDAALTLRLSLYTTDKFSVWVTRLRANPEGRELALAMVRQSIFQAAELSGLHNGYQPVNGAVAGLVMLISTLPREDQIFVLTTLYADLKGIYDDLIPSPFPASVLDRLKPAGELKPAP